MNKELSQEIETRLQLLLTIAIFFPTLLQIGLQGTNVGSEQQKAVLLTWNNPVVYFILSYIFWAVTKKEVFSEKIEKYFSNYLLIGLLLYVFPISTIALNHQKFAPNASGYLEYIYFKIAIYGLPVFSILTMTVLFCSMCWSRLKRNKK